MHSVLVIGCGSIGERHLRCFLGTKRTQVTACDANLDLLRTMAERYGVRTIPAVNDALGEPFDAVIICTPAPLHVPFALQALRSGKHVLIEKPLSHSLSGLEELLAVHRATDRQVAVAYVYHALPFFAAARAFLAEGNFGPVLHASALAGQSFHLLRPAYAQTYYRDRKTGGGAIQDALTHLANAIESVLGPTESVMCDCAHLALPNVTVEDTAHVAARHKGALASYCLNQFQAPNETSLQFDTAQGSVRIELHRQRWGSFRSGDADWQWHEGTRGDRDAPFITQANAFLDQIEGQPARLCSLEAGAHTLRFNLAALASAERGVRVSCDDASLHA